MKKHELAGELRRRQLAQRRVPKKLIRRLSDDDIIDAYITCSCCGEKEVDGPLLALAILKAESVEHFFALCSTISKASHGGSA